MMRQTYRVGLGGLFAMGLTMLLLACGGGEEGSGIDGPTALTGAEAAGGGPLRVTLEAPERIEPGSDIRLRWRAQGGAVRFAVFVQPAAGLGFERVDAVVTDHTARLKRGPSRRYDFPTAEVRVQGCNRAGRCVHSDAKPLTEVLLAGVARLGATGLQGPNPLFGAPRVALDGDGRTLMAAVLFDHIPNDPAFPGSGSLIHFDRSAAGAWTQQARLERLRVRNYFGDPMALSADGNTLAVGVPADAGTVGGINAPEVGRRDGPDWDSRGGVHVYVRTPQGHWQHQAFLKPAETRYNEQIGIEVALSANGDRLLAAGQTGEGRTVLFAREGTQWREDWRFESRPDLQLQSRVGMAISGDGRSVAFRMALSWEMGSWTKVNWAVHVYRPCPCAIGWQRVADLRSSKPMQLVDAQDDDEFGTGLSFSHDGRTLAVGAPWDRGNAQDDGDGVTDNVHYSGAVYVFAQGTGGTWQRQAFLKPRTAAVGDQMGKAVAISADGRVIVAKACGFAANAAGVRRNHAANAQVGGLEPGQSCYFGASAYVFERAGDGRWSHLAAVIPAPGENASFEWFSPALSADATTMAFGVVTYSWPAGGLGRVMVY